MKEISCIKKILENHSIINYKIIKNTNKEFTYRNVFKKILIDEANEDKFFIIFNYKNRLSKFSISSGQTENLINHCIDSCIKNSITNADTWQEFTCEHKSDNFKNNNWFMNFKKNDYILWLEKEIKKIYNEVDFDFNFVYSAKFNKYIISAKSSYNEQYTSNSECVCMENANFIKKAMLNDYFLNSALSKNIIQDFSKENPPFKNIDFNKEYSFSIESKAFAQILETYIKIYYANNIYLGQSFIKFNQLNAPISNVKFNIWSLPYKGVTFDGEGNTCSKKLIISSGKLIDLISNSDYSRYLGLPSYGNATLDSPQNISHQRLFFEFVEKKSMYNSCNIIIKDFDYIYIDYIDQHFKGIATYYKNGNAYKTPINFSINHLFNNIYPLSHKPLYNRNVFCPDVIVLNK